MALNIVKVLIGKTTEKKHLVTVQGHCLEINKTIGTNRGVRTPYTVYNFVAQNL